MAHPSPAPRVPVARPWLPDWERYAAALREIFASRRLSNFADYSRRLEERAAEVLGHPAPLCVSSCDVGMVLAWRALGCRSGQVIVPSFTLCSTVNALRWNGLEPVFADVDPETLCLSPAEVRRKLGPRTVGVAAVHVFGRPAAGAELEAVARDAGVKLLFDAAHGIGALHGGRPLGGFGDAAVFSLSGTKLVTAGEGGLAVFRDPEAAERFRTLRGYGFLGDYNCQDVGLNGKLSEMNAALGWLSLETLPEVVAQRQTIADYYRMLLEDVPGLRFQLPADGDRHAYKDFAVLFPTAGKRVAAESALRRAGIETKRYFRPVHQSRAYAGSGARLPVTEDAYARVLCLPIFHDIEPETVQEVCAVVRRAVAGKEVVRGVA